MKRKLRTGQKEKHTMYVMVSKFENYSHIIKGSLARTKRECLRKGIEVQWGHDKNGRIMNQSCKETWKELRKDKKWSIQKITFTTLYNI